MFPDGWAVFFTKMLRRFGAEQETDNILIHSMNIRSIYVHKNVNDLSMHVINIDNISKEIAVVVAMVTILLWSDKAERSKQWANFGITGFKTVRWNDGMVK